MVIMKQKVGIIGYGFVGKAVCNSFTNKNDIDLYILDPRYPDISTSIEEIKKCEAVFICVPTNQLPNGRCDTGPLFSVIEQLQGYNGIVISKSTAPPNVYKSMQDTTDLMLVHAPEFLTAKNALHDYLHPVKVIIGAQNQEEANRAAHFILPYIIPKSVEYCSIEEAAMFKYLANTMLAMKVIINNEYAELCEKLGINWSAVSKIAETDIRLGVTHWQVPGPDGKHGFGGACFPKDTSALVDVAASVGVEMSMLTNAIRKNSNLRDDI